MKNRLILATAELETRRRELGALLDIPAETRAEDFDGKVEAVKARITAASQEVSNAALAEPEIPEHRQDNAEGREIRSMLESANIGAIYAATLAGKAAPDGVEAELQKHYGIGPNSIPLEMLEQRAYTPAPTNTERSQAAIIQPVFHDGDAAYLSVSMPTIPAGDAVFPVLTSRPTVGGPHTDDTSVAETTGAFDAEMLSPARLQASFFYRRTDAARFPGMGEALRQALNSGLSEALDKETVDQIVSDVTRTDASAADSFASYRKRLVYDQIEGRFASMESDMRMLVGTATLADMSELYRGNNADDSAVDSLRRISRRPPGVSAHRRCCQQQAGCDCPQGIADGCGCPAVARRQSDSRRNHKGQHWRDHHHRDPAGPVQGNPDGRLRPCRSATRLTGGRYGNGRLRPDSG